jgi:uncharacterized protein YdeI (YjbR/CyaY-like superfamily)
VAEANPDFRHETPAELSEILAQDGAFKTKWDGLTDLARNEWICWMSSPKKQETRDPHVKRLREEVLDGKRRPCCWPGCPHRRPSAGKFFRD